MNKQLKFEIIKLREEGKTYDEIKNILNCSKGTIGYHCVQIPQNKMISKINIDKKNEKQKKHTKKINIQKNKIKKEIILNHPVYSDQKLFRIIKILYHYRINMNEISDILNLKYYTICKVCNRLYQKQLKDNKNYTKVKDRRQKLKLLGAIYLGGKCQKCGYDKSLSAFDFHHKNPDNKEFTIASCCNIAWKKMKQELDKCILLCSNCHRELHNPDSISLKTINKIE